MQLYLLCGFVHGTEPLHFQMVFMVSRVVIGQPQLSKCIGLYCQEELVPAGEVRPSKFNIMHDKTYEGEYFLKNRHAMPPPHQGPLHGNTSIRLNRRSTVPGPPPNPSHSARRLNRRENHLYHTLYHTLVSHSMYFTHSNQLFACYCLPCPTDQSAPR